MEVREVDANVKEEAVQADLRETGMENVKSGLGNTGSVDFDLMLDDLITRNTLYKTFALAPNFNIEIKTLSTEEVLESDSVYIANDADMPTDVVLRIRAVNAAVRAITKINSVPVIIDKDPKKTAENRNKLRKRLLSAPPTLVDKINSEYRALVAEQNDLLRSVDNIKNF